MSLISVVERIKESFENGEDFNVMMDDIEVLDKAVTALEACKKHAENIIEKGYHESFEASSIVDNVNSVLSADE